jgi:multiple sugar transport system substrate-binding protein
MNRKLPILALGAIACLFTLAGCKSKPGSDGDAGAGTSLRFWAMPNTSKPQADLEQILERFKAENPDIDVQVEILDWGNALDRITKAANSGIGPDVFQIGTTYTASITDLGGLLALNDVVGTVGGDSVFVPAVRSYMKPIYADSITSMPWFVDVRPVYYRTDVFAKLNLDPAQVFETWDSYREGMKSIKDAHLSIEGQKMEAVGLAGKNDWNVVHNIYPWIVGNGGGIINELGDSVLLDDEKSIEGVLTFLQLIREGLSPKSYLEKSTAQVSAEFDQGRIATWQETTSKLVYLERPSDAGGVGASTAAKNFASALPPAGPAGRKLFIGGSNLAIFKSSKNIDAARKLIAFLTTDTGAVLDFCKASGMAPALIKVYESDYFKANPNRKLYKDLALAGKAYPAVPYWGALETSILNTRFGNIFDIASESEAPFSEAAVRKEMKEAAKQARELIESQLKSKPQYLQRLERLHQQQGI